MKIQKMRYFVLALAVMLVGVVGATPALAQGPEGVIISSPADGETVSNVVVVTGAIDFADFMKYDFFVNNGNNMIWVATGYSPVVNGNILRLDTKTLIDGNYQVVVRKVTTDSQYTDTYGPNFTVSNGQSAPNPFPEIEATFLYPAPGKGTVRVRNCTGEGVFIDYASPEGFKSSGEISLSPKPQDAPICPYADIALVPGEYRGTAKGAAQIAGVNFMFDAGAGKVYEMTYNGPSAGAGQLYIAERQPDERAGTDTGGLDAQDPGRMQNETDIQAGTAAATESEAGKDMAATESGTAQSAEQPSTDTKMLPVSGQAAQPQTPFIIAAAALILLMVVGGVFAIRRGKQAAS